MSPLLGKCAADLLRNLPAIDVNLEALSLQREVLNTDVHPLKVDSWDELQQHLAQQSGDRPEDPLEIERRQDEKQDTEEPGVQPDRPRSQKVR